MAAIVNDRDALIMGAVPRYTPPANIGLFLSPESAIFKLSADQSSALPGSFTFKALPPNAEGVVTFTWSAGLTFTVSGNTATLTYANFTAGSGTLTATIDVDGVTYTKTSTITKLADGAPGAAGTKSAPVFLYQWSASAPAAPTGTSTLTWATGINSNYTGPDGWAASAPANPGTPGLRLYVVTRTVTAAADVATTSGISYLGLTATAWTQNGAAGVPGLQSAAPEVYQWAATIPAGPVGNPTWNWNTRSFGAAPANWTLAPGAPVAGHTLWAAVVQLVDSAGATATAFNWNAASIVARGYAGSNGTAGGAGAEGASYVTAYVATAVGTASTAPAPTTGKTSVPPPNSSGLPGTPQATVPTLTAGQYQMQFDGVYNPATNLITWSIPYQSSAKFGSLSAITTNTGALTVTGDLSSANGLFKVDANGLATMRAVQISTADGTVLFSTGTGLSLAGAAPDLSGAINSAATKAIYDNVTNRPTDVSNLIKKGGFDDDAMGGWPFQGTESIAADNAAAVPAKRQAVSHQRDCLEIGNPIPVTPGETIYISGWINSQATSYAGGIGLVGYDKNGTSGDAVQFALPVAVPAGSPWRYVETSVVIAPGVAQVLPWVHQEGFDFSSGNWLRVACLWMGRHARGATYGADWATNVTGAVAVNAQILAAQNSAEEAMVRVNAEADNNVLDRGEKPAANAAWAAIEDERPRLILQAQDVSVSYAAYDAAKQSLSDYLGSLPGGWSNTLTDTPINRTTYIQLWNGYYLAKIELLKAISARAAVLASWSGVTGAGKPADNATVGGTFGPSGNITGQMTVAQVPNHIPANGITDSLIGGNLKSTNWNGATDTSGAGWLLERATGNLYCNSIRARGAVMGGGYTGYVWPTSGIGGFYLGPEGLLLGNPSTGRYLQVESNGTLNAPGFSIANGRANFSGNFNTGVGAGFRIEMGPDDPVYAMWAGSGAKNDSNAIFYLKRSGAGYFGGSLSAGTLRTAVTNPSLDANVQLINGPFGTNGGAITVVCSYDYLAHVGRDGGTYSMSGPESTAIIRLYRKIGDAAETLVQTFTANGSTLLSNSQLADELSFYDRTLGGSFTFTDNAGGSENRTYRATLTDRNFKTITFNPSNGGLGNTVSYIRQTLTIVTTE